MERRDPLHGTLMGRSLSLVSNGRRRVGSVTRRNGDPASRLSSCTAGWEERWVSVVGRAPVLLVRTHIPHFQHDDGADESWPRMRTYLEICPRMSSRYRGLSNVRSYAPLYLLERELQTVSVGHSLLIGV